jgi:MobI protein
MNNEPANKRPSTVTVDDVLTWIEAKVDQLHAETRVLVDDYWRRLKAEQKKHAPSEKARIGVRVRRREASLSFSIEWFRMAMIRDNGRLKPIARYLKKGPGYHYPLGRLLQGEPDWEADLVEELETEFADIRKQIALLGKIRDAVQSYRKTTKSHVA